MKGIMKNIVESCNYRRTSRERDLSVYGGKCNLQVRTANK